MDLGCVQPCMITKVFKTGVLNLQGCKTEKEAAKARDVATKEHYGEYGNLNFPIF